MLKSNIKVGIKRSSIAVKFALYILLFSSIITLFSTSLQLYLDYSKDKKSLEKRLDIIEASYIHSIETSIWLTNDDLLMIQLQGIHQLPDIQKVIVHLDDNRLFSAGEKKGNFLIEKDIPLNYSYRDKKVFLGTLSIVVSLEGIYYRLLDRAWVILATQAIKTFLVSLFIFLLFYLLVGRHLYTLARFAKSLTPDLLTHHKNLKLIKNGSDDELTLLEHSLNEMQANLSDSYQSMEAEIAKRKQVEKEMRQLLNSTHEGIYGIDLKGDCTFVNQSCLDILGYSSVDELIGKNMHDEIHHHYQDGNYYPVEQCYIFKAFKEGKGTTVDNEVFWCKDGSYFPAEYSSYPIFDDDRAVGAVVSFIDITERKITEEKIQLSEEKYRLAMEATQDGLWDWNITTGEVYYSPGWCKTLGETSLENNYASWEQRIFNEDKERIRLTLQEHFSGNTEIWQTEHRLRKADNSYTWVLGRGQVVKRDEHGKALRMIGTITDIHNKKENEEVIWHQANYDPLTSLPNRKFFQELLNKGILNAQRDQEQLWLLFLDLDGFKEVNDTLGHDKGDELLVLVCERLQSLFRESDTLARLGGDEFVIILHQVQYINDIDRIASNIIDLISEPYKLGENMVYITTSIGIANYPNDAENAIDLLKFADQSMYAAKKEGKNRYTYFTSSLQQGSLIRIQMYAELRKAISNNEFELYYQPIINLKNDRIHKAEALIRWQHPEKGFLNPGGFIQLAEETGIICDIGIWIFEHAFNQLNNWRPLLSDDFQLSINMSPMQLKTKDKKYEVWMEKINTPHISGGSIVIEITEGMLIKDDPVIVKKLLKLRDEGIQVAIDDFGTGYSSLSYIKEFDIDYLKIDQSFVFNLKPDSIEESLCRAIVVMAHTLDLKVIAEGIETQQQLDLLKAMGCDYGQGFLFSRPIPANQFEQLIRQDKYQL